MRNINSTFSKAEIKSRQKKQQRYGIRKIIPQYHNKENVSHAIDSYKQLHSTIECICSSNVHGVFRKIDHILCQKESLNTFPKLYYLMNILLSNGIKLQINTE